MRLSITINGHFICQTKNFAAESECHYRCREGWVPGNAITMICRENKNENGQMAGYEWDKGETSFSCVKSIRYDDHKLIVFLGYKF